eukprot:sb/3471094/
MPGLTNMAKSGNPFHKDSNLIWTNQGPVFRSRDWLSANQGPVSPLNNPRTHIAQAPPPTSTSPVHGAEGSRQGYTIALYKLTHTHTHTDILPHSYLPAPPLPPPPRSTGQRAHDRVLPSRWSVHYKLCRGGKVGVSLLTYKKKKKKNEKKRHTGVCDILPHSYLPAPPPYLHLPGPRGRGLTTGLYHSAV